MIHVVDKAWEGLVNQNEKTKSKTAHGMERCGSCWVWAGFASGNLLSHEGGSLEMVSFSMGPFDAATAEMRRACELDPLHPIIQAQ